MSDKKEALFSKKNRQLMTDPLDGSNPISVQVLGICSALAITVQVEQAFVMSAAVMAVLMFGNMIVSAMRNYIPSRIRIIVQLVIVAALVILVNELLKAFMPDVSESLSVFVGLIITNCIIMGRLEAFALGNKVWPSLLDAIGNGLGYGWILVVVAFFRELFGSGKIFGLQIIPDAFYEAGYMNNNMMILPPMALITVALIIWVQRSKNTDLIEEN
jgi:Na+-transporting NADH:ubiquinone oxidoreductase subunit D